MICFYCEEEADTRPYGPGGTPTCLPCLKADPARNELAQQAFNAQVEAALAAASNGGFVILDTDTGDLKIMSREEIEEYGGRND